MMHSLKDNLNPSVDTDSAYISGPNNVGQDALARKATTSDLYGEITPEDEANISKDSLVPNEK